MVSWAMALTIVGITLLYFHSWVFPSSTSSGSLPAASGRSPYWFVFPVCFFLIAVPWLRPIENLTMTRLAQANAAAAAELLNAVGEPALRHGNTLEVGTGVVGIDDACSGIRSLQATLMIALFLGELRALGLAARVGCVLAGIALSFLFNVLRTTTLAWVASRKGIPAIDAWHDPTGIVLLVACFACLWAVAGLLARHAPERRADGREAAPAESMSDRVRFPGRKYLVTALALWLIVAEAGVFAWYHFRESRVTPQPAWTIAWPVDYAEFSKKPISDRTSQVLGADQAVHAEWTNGEAQRWQANYLVWNPGRTAGYLARRHTPEACLPGVGCVLEKAGPLKIATAGSIQLPVQIYTFLQRGEPLHVLYCRWEDGMAIEDYIAERLTVHNILRAIWMGRGNLGQKVLEIAVTGIGDPQEAEAALLRQLGELVKSENTTPARSSSEEKLKPGRDDLPRRPQSNPERDNLPRRP